jgi:hypothetical protein
MNKFPVIEMTGIEKIEVENLLVKFFSASQIDRINKYIGSNI